MEPTLRPACWNLKIKLYKSVPPWQSCSLDVDQCKFDIRREIYWWFEPYAVTEIPAIFAHGRVFVNNIKLTPDTTTCGGCRMISLNSPLILNLINLWAGQLPDIGQVTPRLQSNLYMKTSFQMARYLSTTVFWKNRNLTITSVICSLVIDIKKIVTAVTSYISHHLCFCPVIVYVLVSNMPIISHVIQIYMFCF